jgi:hypothetical protein
MHQHVNNKRVTGLLPRFWLGFVLECLAFCLFRLRSILPTFTKEQGKLIIQYNKYIIKLKQFEFYCHLLLSEHPTLFVVPIARLDCRHDAMIGTSGPT